MKHRETVFGVAALVLVLGIVVGVSLWKSREEAGEQRRAMARAEELGRAAGPVIDFRGGANRPLARAFEGDEETETNSAPRRAWRLCTGAVKASLKAPGTAAFPAFTVDKLRQIRGTNRFSVVGWVDAQNDFGALLRSDWTCAADLDAEVGRVTSFTPR